MKDAELQAKVLAPALTATAFIQQSSDSELDYENYQLRSPQEVASYLMALYESTQTVGIVNEKNEFILSNPIFPVFSI